MSKILIFGDICPTEDYRGLFDTGNIFSADILSEIKAADYVVANLECPATASNIAIKKAGPNLKACPKDIDKLASIGFDAFSLANNHIMDYGITGLEDTLSAFKSNGLRYFGAGNNAKEASEPLIINLNKKKVGFISFADTEFNLASEHTPGANHFDLLDSFDLIRNLRSKVDYLIVLYHGGIEYYQYPSPLVQKKCRKLIDCGADLISIQHSHCIGTIENYKSGHIIYGQGNSVFGLRPKSLSWNEGLLVEIDLESKSVDYKLMSATAGGVCFADDATSQSVLGELYKRSEKVYDPEWIKSSWINFCLSGKSLTLPQLYGRGIWFNRLNRLVKNRLIDWLYPRSAKMTTMNLMRCEAHHEMMCTILEQEVFNQP